MTSLLDQITRMPISSLTLHPHNPRRGNVGVIAESLRKNEQFAPIVVQLSTRYVLSGNHTLLAARTLGWDEIDAVLVDVDDDHARRIMLAANRTAELGTYDFDALAELLSYLDGDYTGSGWTDADVEALLTPPDDSIIDPTEGVETSEDGKGNLLALAGTTIGEPDHPVDNGDVWRMGDRLVLVVANPHTEWQLWAPLLKGDALLLPYPSPLAAVSDGAKDRDVVFVQPNKYLAGWLLTKWARVTGGTPSKANS